MVLPGRQALEHRPAEPTLTIPRPRPRPSPARSGASRPAGRTPFGRPRRLALAAMLAACLAVLGAGALRDVPEVVELAPPLRQLAAARHLVLGTAVRLNALQSDQAYASVLANQYDAITPENEMKWENIQPGPHTFDFGSGDALVSFAQAHHMIVRGHNLVWYEQNPAWLTGRRWTRAQLMAVLRDHILTVVGHYRGRVAQWDVVNEAVEDTGQLRRNVWLDGIGPDYIAMAFRWAHQADPSAELFYNDYGIEFGGAKTDAVYRLLASLRGQGVPVDGLGIQMHDPVSSASQLPALPAVMGRFNALGLDVAVTEMDVWLPARQAGPDLRAQAAYFGQVLEDCLAAARCSTFSTWGFTDRDSWVPARFPGYVQALPFSAGLEPKPAARELQRVLSGAPRDRRT